MGDLRFDGRVAVVTGAGGGLGREHALLLAARGARVVANDAGTSVAGEGFDPAPAARTAGEIEDLGGVAVADTSSVATPEGGEAVVRTALEAFGRVDIVVNNAGVLHDRAFHHLAPDLVDTLLDVHLRGAFWVTRPAWTLMRAQGYGRVVFTSSAAGLFGNFGQAAYGAAKAGLLGLTRALAAEGARHNVRANAIAPVARTRMTEDVLGPLAERLDPGLVAPVVAWLAHEDCPVSGEVYSAGGGRVARVFVGVTPGIFDPRLTPESMRDHAEAVGHEEGYAVPADAAEEVRELLRRLG